MDFIDPPDTQNIIASARYLVSQYSHVWNWQPLIVFGIGTKNESFAGRDH